MSPSELVNWRARISRLFDPHVIRRREIEMQNAVLYEIITDPYDDGSRDMFHVLVKDGWSTPSRLKQTLRSAGADRERSGLSGRITGMIYRYAGSESEGEPILLMRFNHTPSYCELIPIEAFEIEKYGNG